MQKEGTKDNRNFLLRLYGTFKTRLLFLVLLGVIPAWVLLLLANIKRQEAERSQLRTEAASAARMAAISQEYFIRQTKQLLRTMTQFPHLVLLPEKEVAAVGMKNLKLLAPAYSDFGLVERDGTLFCSTQTTNVGPDIIDSRMINLARERQQFAMGQGPLDASTGRPAIQFAYPVFNTGKKEVQRIMFGTLKPGLLSEALAEIDLPPKSSIQVFDGLGTLVAEIPKRADSGESAVSPDKIGKDGFPAEGVMQFNISSEKHVVAISHARVDAQSFFWVQVSIPQNELFAKADAQFAANLIGMILIGALVLGGTRLFSERAFLQPVNTLLAATERLKDGDLDARTSLQPGASELHELGHRFDLMAKSLAERQNELQLAKEELSKSNALLEKRVEERTKSLTTLNEELEAFSYSVSHDLRAPLRHINGFAQMLLETNSDPKVQHYGSIITRSANHMGQLIDDLLSFSRMARQTMAIEKVDIAEIVQQVITQSNSSDSKRNISWLVGPLPSVTADGPMIKQVWENLISNAVKYSSKTEKPVIEIGSENGEGEFIFWVRDNGAGFDMKYASKLFGVFQRLHKAEDFEGTGLGLAIVRRIINRHGGRTWAEGKPGESAKFFFTLPNQSSDRPVRNQST